MPPPISETEAENRLMRLADDTNVVTNQLKVAIANPGREVNIVKVNKQIKEMLERIKENGVIHELVRLSKVDDKSACIWDDWRDDKMMILEEKWK